MKDPSNPKSLHVVLKPLVLPVVMKIWGVKIRRGPGDEMLLTSKDVDGDGVDPEDTHTPS